MLLPLFPAYYDEMDQIARLVCQISDRFNFRFHFGVIISEVALKTELIYESI